MSGLEVIGAVAAVVSAFHGGAELVAHIKKKHRKRKSEQAYKEKQLQESLQTGEVQVEQRYASDCRELGEWVKRGDVVARDRLLHIAVVMQAEIIRSLQLAVKYENAILDLTVLHEASIMNRKDTIVTLDELKQRVLLTLPVERNLAPPLLEPPRQTSFDSSQSFSTANAVPDDYLPPAVTIPDETDTRTGISRLISLRRSSGRSQPQHSRGSSHSSVSFNSQSGRSGPTIQGRDPHVDLMNDIHDTLNSFQGLQISNTRRDTLDQLQSLSLPSNDDPRDPRDLSNHPAFAQSNNQTQTTFSQPFFETPLSFHRNDSTSTRSAYSDKMPASLSSTSNYSTSPPTSQPAFSPRTSLNSPITPTTPLSPDVQLGAFNKGHRSIDSATTTPSTATVTALSSPNPSANTYSVFPPASRMAPRPPLRSSTIMSQTHMMDGRPCKDNNYWGFCKGAWATREDLKKGLSVQTRPEGLYSTVSVWQCKHCLFQGDTFTITTPSAKPKGKPKKEITVDPNVHVSAVGIRYRWVFLAKSHVKKKSMPTSNMATSNGGEKGECNYGCIFCCTEGKSTGIYGNVQTLMNHVFLEHAKGMKEDVRERTRCIMGREAGKEEVWDVNVPFKRFLDDGTAVKEEVE
ncbi:hypothetical protein K432DRAFT_376868 [Lepidopterella palustris CBS 459.81]|uniref:Uncharacterized protein n=1 Tax=Lepidopterella palustris CBS 459.81 TaxID=1314670 RepID=A0A8E2EMS5_9PEZI|nr:hypothetical protein K432DRAFT_376868 [Lepidopterella palustris CBS 459.81]